MDKEALLLSIFREERRHYIGALRKPRSSRIDARHRVIMLKDMPYRDDLGRILPIQLSAEFRLNPHRRGNSPVRKYRLPVIRLPGSHSPEKQPGHRKERERSQRQTRCEFVINSCRELSTSRESSPVRDSPPRKSYGRTHSSFEVR